MMSSSKAPTKTDFKQLVGGGGATTAKKIDSPFAKYNSADQLTCIICNQVVKSELVWNAHVNSRSHLENKNKLKSKLVDGGSSSSTPAAAAASTPSSASSSSPSTNRNGTKKDDQNSTSSESAPVFKRPAVPPPSTNKQLLNKLISDAEKESDEEEEDEENVQLKSKRQKIENLVNAADSIDLNKKAEEDKTHGPATSSSDAMIIGGADLPEGFFDDPDQDARARGTTRAQHLDAEYEEFKKAMQTEEVKSDQIIEKDDLMRDVDRDLVEVDELITRWTRIEKLHQKREALKAASSGGGGQPGSEEMSSGKKKKQKDNESDDDDDEDVDLESVMGLALRAKNIC